MGDDGGQGIRAPEDQPGLLAGVIQAFASSLGPDETLKNAVAQITRHLQAEAASLFRLGGDTGDLVCFASAGHRPPRHRGRDGRFEEIRPSARPGGLHWERLMRPLSSA